MASPGKMTKTMATVLGLPEAQVVQHDRNLAVFGFRTVGGRGKSAAKMTAVDAANLLIGVCASSQVKDTVQAVNDYAILPAKPADIWSADEGKLAFGKGWVLHGLEMPRVQGLPEDHNFRDALAAFIESAIDGSFQEAATAHRERKSGRPPKLWRMEVIFIGPFPQASISLFFLGKREYHYYSNIPNEAENISRYFSEIHDEYSEGDLTQTRMFTDKTIVALGNLLKY